MKRAYEDPRQPGSLGGVRRFARAQGVKPSQVRQTLQGLLSYSLHRPRRRRAKTLPTLVFDRDEQWQMDLVDVQKLARQNGGFKYWLTCMDVLSKVGWLEPIKNKTGREMVRALEAIKARASPRHPLRVQTDLGKEFYNAPVQRWFAQQGWHHFSTSGDAKASVVERWHRTLKERLYRYLTARNTLRYAPILQDLVRGYNASRHRSIGLAPSEVTEARVPEVWTRLYGQRLGPRPAHGAAPLKVGDKVRLNQKHRPFEKGYLQGWTEEVFVVARVQRRADMITYKLKEWDGTPIKGTFYPEDVQKVTVGDDSLFRVERIIRRRGGRVLVRWKGWPDKYDSWIARRDLRVRA